MFGNGPVARQLRRRCAAAGLTLAIFSPPATAWNAAGHRLSALIAWQQLDPGTRQRISGLLARHPDYELWNGRAAGSDREASVFLEASTWPDDIKNDRRFHDAEERPTDPIPGFPDMRRHRDWHYINRPLGHPATTPMPFGQLDKRLDLLTKQTGDPKTGDRARVYALPWLIHLVADAHQPLHVVSRYDNTGRGDEGGNRIFVEHPMRTRKQPTSLHAYWDDLPGPPWLRGERLERSATAIAAAHPQPPPAGTTGDWLQESWSIAMDSAYPTDDDGPTPTLTAEFHMRAIAIARQRVAEAGYRLAELLKRLLAPPVETEPHPVQTPMFHVKQVGGKEVLPAERQRPQP